VAHGIDWSKTATRFYVSGWVSLGTWSFASGNGDYVKTTASGGGCARADAVKFVRTA
jgi:hypothetical protein